MEENQLLYQIALTKIFNVGNIHAKNLVSFCGGVEAVFNTSKKALLKIPGIGKDIVADILAQKMFVDAERELRYVQDNNIDVLFYLNADYPQRLKHYPDCPIVLYYKGNAPLDHGRNVAIVGTRKPTTRGKIICEQLVEELQDFGVQIISGLAYGIDITAHRKSVECNIPTVGVMGNGMKHIYPAAHHQTATKMLQNGGLLTEFSSELGPDYHHFPLRNRIIAGLCDALIVVETAKKGGSIITANYANNYNKDVFAVPGRITDKTSAGCNHLIKTHQAFLIQNAKDIGYIMRWDKLDATKTIQTQLFVELSQGEQRIVDALKETDAKSVDQLSYEAQVSASDIAGVLLELEFKGIIQTLPGKRYMLV